MTALKIADLDNGKLDLDHMAAVITDRTSPTHTDRIGQVMPTMYTQLLRLGYSVPIAYTTGIVFGSGDIAKTVEYDDVVYAPILSQLPFTTSGTFETAKFKVVSGITTADLAVNTATSGIGHIQSGSGVRTDRTVKDKLNDLVSVLDWCVGDGVEDDTEALRDAFADGRPLWIPPHANLSIPNGLGVIVPDGGKIFGPGRITHNPTVPGSCVFDIGDGNSESNTDRSNIVIMGVEFYSEVDFSFSFIRMENGGGDLSGIVIRHNKFIYAPEEFTGADRWAVTFGSPQFGDTRERIYIEDNEVFGPMQLTATSGDADYDTISICRNHVVDGRNACIAMTRLSTSSDQNTYRNITIKDNILNTDRTIAIFLGADGDTGATAPMTWEDIDIDNNTCGIEAADGVVPIAILFRAPEGADSVVRRFTIRNNKPRASSNASIAITYSREGVSVQPDVFEVNLTNNELFGGQMSVAGGSLIKVRNNTSDNQLLVSQGAVVEASNNDFAGLRMEDSGTVRSERNRFKPAIFGQCVNIQPASGKTVTLTSVDDTYDSTNGPNYGIRLSGAGGTANVKLLRPNDPTGNWNSGFINLNDGHVLAEYRPRNTTLNVNTTAVGNVGSGTDNLMTYATTVGMLNAAGRGFRITAFGTTANNSNPKTIALLFGSTTIATQALTVSIAGHWRITAEVLKTGTDTQDWSSQVLAGATSINKPEFGTATEDDGASITIKCTGTVTDGGGGINNNDLVQQGMIVEALNN